MLLDDEELCQISGGGVNVSLIASVGAAIAFLISVVDGFLNPNKCMI